MNMNSVKKKIAENVIEPYRILVNEINDLLDSTDNVLPACLFHKYFKKWNNLAIYCSLFFEKEPEAKIFFETLSDFSDIQERDLLVLKMRLTNFRLTDCKISACQTFCKECVLGSFSDDQCRKFFKDIKK
jgi:hypothetical protein